MWMRHKKQTTASTDLFTAYLTNMTLLFLLPTHCLHRLVYSCLSLFLLVFTSLRRPVSTALPRYFRFPDTHTQTHRQHPNSKNSTDPLFFRARVLFYPPPFPLFPPSCALLLLSVSFPARSLTMSPGNARARPPLPRLPLPPAHGAPTPSSRLRGVLDDMRTGTVLHLVVGHTPLHAVHSQSAHLLSAQITHCTSLLSLTVRTRHCSPQALEILLHGAAQCSSLRRVTITGGVGLAEAQALATGLAAFHHPRATPSDPLDPLVHDCRRHARTPPVSLRVHDGGVEWHWQPHAQGTPLPQPHPRPYGGRPQRQLLSARATDAISARPATPLALASPRRFQRTPHCVGGLAGAAVHTPPLPPPAARVAPHRACGNADGCARGSKPQPHAIHLELEFSTVTEQCAALIYLRGLQLATRITTATVTHVASFSAGTPAAATTRRALNKFTQRVQELLRARRTKAMEKITPVAARASASMAEKKIHEKEATHRARAAAGAAIQSSRSPSPRCVDAVRRPPLRHELLVPSPRFQLRTPPQSPHGRPPPRAVPQEPSDRARRLSGRNDAAGPALHTPIASSPHATPQRDRNAVQDRAESPSTSPDTLRNRRRTAWLLQFRCCPRELTPSTAPNPSVDVAARGGRLYSPAQWARDAPRQPAIASEGKLTLRLTPHSARESACGEHDAPAPHTPRASPPTSSSTETRLTPFQHRATSTTSPEPRVPSNWFSQSRSNGISGSARATSSSSHTSRDLTPVQSHGVPRAVALPDALPAASRRGEGGDQIIGAQPHAGHAKHAQDLEPSSNTARPLTGGTDRAVETSNADSSRRARRRARSPLVRILSDKAPFKRTASPSMVQPTPHVAMAAGTAAVQTGPAVTCTAHDSHDCFVCHPALHLPTSPRSAREDHDDAFQAHWLRTPKRSSVSGSPYGLTPACDWSGEDTHAAAHLSPLSLEAALTGAGSQEPRTPHRDHPRHPCPYPSRHTRRGDKESDNEEDVGGAGDRVSPLVVLPCSESFAAVCGGGGEYLQAPLSASLQHGFAPSSKHGPHSLEQTDRPKNTDAATSLVSQQDAARRTPDEAVAYVRACVSKMNASVATHTAQTTLEAKRVMTRVQVLNEELTGSVTSHTMEILAVLDSWRQQGAYTTTNLAATE